MPTTEATIWKILEEVPDPEIPVLSVIDLGIVREVKLVGDKVKLSITPTYSGCPAMNLFEVNIKAALQEKGFYPIEITTILSPAWTTDWLSEKGKEKLKAYGIAPPVSKSMDKHALFFEEKGVNCPQCDSSHTKMLSQFGSTACKALYKCEDCLEPFDYFKCL